MKTKAGRRRRWTDRAKRYVGGALMILAPLQLGGCGTRSDKQPVPQPDSEIEDILQREAIAIAPMDMFRVDNGKDGDGFSPPEMIAIAPADMFPPEVIAIAPAEVFPPEAIAIDAVEPEMIAIAPADIGEPDVTPPAPGGFNAVCTDDKDCLQEYFCKQTMFCIAPADGDNPPPGCNQKNCVPEPCATSEDCPTGSDCAPYGTPESVAVLTTCVRDAGKVPGGFGADCLGGKPCDSPQLFCENGCPGICIIPVEICMPVQCDPGKGGLDCPEKAECKDVGVTTACVKK